MYILICNIIEELTLLCLHWKQISTSLLCWILDKQNFYYFSISLHFRIEHDIFIMTINLCKSAVKVPSYLIFSIHTNFLTCNKTELNAGCSFRCILKLRNSLENKRIEMPVKLHFTAFRSNLLKYSLSANARIFFTTWQSNKRGC